MKSKKENSMGKKETWEAGREIFIFNFSSYKNFGLSYFPNPMCFYQLK
jgi:hypothetical protein